MGSTFVTLGRDASGNPASGETQVGFWMQDSILEIWLRLLALHIREPQEYGDIANVIRNQWLFASRHHFMGCVPHFLEEATSSTEGFSLVVDAVQSLSVALASATGHICGESLSLLCFESEMGDVEIAVLRDVAAAFRDLLNRKDAFDGSPSRDGPDSNSEKRHR